MTLRRGSLTLHRGQDRLFEYANQFVILMAGLAVGCLWVSKKLVRLDPDDVSAIISSAFPLVLSLPLGGVLETAYADTPVNSLKFEIEQAPDPQSLLNQSASDDGFTKGFNSVVWHTISPIFVEFFEDHKPWVEANIGKINTWPSTFYFARAIRNAITHGGKLNMTDKRATNAEWHQFNFGRSDDGKQILGETGIFSPADLFFLMLDASDELDALGCPLTPP